MKGKLLKILIAVFAVALIAPAFSAVENVKVGGDISIYGVLRGDFDIVGAPTGKNNEDLHFFQTSARVYVSADLSDNVSAMVRLINERNWGYENTGTDIDLDLGYIQVKDLLTPGLNLTVGRQEIQLGEGLVVGSAYNAYNNNYAVANLAAKDLGLQKAFDAVKLDYKASAVPLSITAFLSKIDEELYDDQGEQTLYGLNLGYKVADIADLDVYYVRKAIDEPADVTLDTAGIRVVSKIPAIQNFNLKAEYAKQFGEAGDADFEGSAILLGGEYKFSANMEPTIKVNYNIFSGPKENETDVKEWVPVFPSNIGSRIGPLFYAYDAWNKGKIIGSESNLKVLNIGFSLKPVEKLTLSLDGYWLKTDEKVNITGGTSDEIGKEIDLGIEYKYSEDLVFGLSLGKILADDLIEKNLSGAGDDAWQVIASMKVSF
jgi:hypothetical protein